MKYYSLILIFLLAAYSTILNAQQTSYAIIGDFGTGYADETVVANLVKSWNPQFIITTGDNRYGDHNFDETVGNDYCEFLAGAEAGSNCDGNGSAVNAFFPSTGNHDFTDGGGINEYLAYFDLPGTGIQSSGTSGSELYYDFVRGPIHFFVIDSYDALVNGSMTAQQTWFQEQVAASSARWKIVYFHHPPYTSSSAHPSTLPMRWSFAQWGIDAVISGHAHTYERLNYDGITYLINGLGGATIHGFSSPLPGSIVRYNATYGAQMVVADDTSMTFSFININGLTIDEHAIHKALPPNNAPVFSSDTILETSASEDSTYQNSIAEYASDPDEDSLVCSFISGPGWLTIASDGDLSGTPLNEDVGLNSWIVEVEDERHGTDTATLQIIVLNTNDAPVFSSDTILETSASEDTTYLKSIAEYASDPDDDSLVCSIISGPSWLSLAHDGDLSGTPLNDNVGLNSWTIKVDDGLLGTDTATLQINVLNTNDAPEFSSDTIRETSALKDTAYLNSIDAHASDPDGDSLNYTIISGPVWLSVAPNGDLSGTPLNADLGLNSWIVEVDDGLFGTDTTLLQITVLSGTQDSVSTGHTIYENATGEDDSEALFMVYPNPASDRLIVQIKGFKGKKTLSLYNISGRTVYAKSTLAEQVEIDVTSFPKGIYFLRINYENLSESKEILIQ